MSRDNATWYCDRCRVVTPTLFSGGRAFCRVCSLPREYLDQIQYPAGGVPVADELEQPEPVDEEDP